jgi:hypothetical protein
MILCHSLHVQIFKGDQIISLNQHMTDPMRVILPLIGDFFMPVGKEANRLLPAMGTFSGSFL